MSKEFYGYIRDCLVRRQRLVLATVMARTGSGPREAGASMAIEEGGKSMGTVGGGLLEAQVLAAAEEVFHSARPVSLAFSLTAKEVAAGGMLCGGKVEVLVDILEGKDPVFLLLFKKIIAAREEGRSAWVIRSVSPERSEGKINSPPIEHAESQSGHDHVLVETAMPVINSAVITGLGFMDEDDLDPGTMDMVAMTADMLKEERRRTEATLIACGGVRYLIQPVVPTGWVIIAGAGHVAKELADLCQFLALRTVVIDDRREYAGPDRFPAAEEIVIAGEAFQDCFLGKEISRDCAIVIVTRGHEHDRNVLAQALRTEAGYIGMIGSLRKRDAVYRSLRKEGFSPEELARVHCPIGVAIGARTPAEIAVSIAAELIAFRAGKTYLGNQ